jgi:hypothetical protein
VGSSEWLARLTDGSPNGSFVKSTDGNPEAGGAALDFASAHPGPSPDRDGMAGRGCAGWSFETLGYFASAFIAAMSGSA